MSANRNENGYDITSQNYFEDLGRHLESPIEPPTRQSVSEARGKLRWEGVECLLSSANREKELRQNPSFTYKGHVTRAVDGTCMRTPRTPDLLKHFTPSETHSGYTHYPSLLAVTATNVFTGQPISTQISDNTVSEREGLRKLINGVFQPGDLSLLDRGLGGDWVFLEFEKCGQFYLCRIKFGGKKRTSSQAKYFLKHKKKSWVISKKVTDRVTGIEYEIQIRFIVGPIDGEGKRIIFATNLIDESVYTRKSLLKLYRMRWATETLYGRVKTLLKIERFHAQSYNGVMQEIFANLLVLSLTAFIWASTILHENISPQVIVPSFKNAVEVLRRHLLDVIDHRIIGGKPPHIAKTLVEQTGRVLWKKQSDRAHPRVSMQPVNTWARHKQKRIAQFNAAQKKRALT